MKQEHWAIFITNDSKKNEFIEELLSNDPPAGLNTFKNLKGALFSKLAVEQYMDEEDRHDTKLLTKGVSQSLQSMSSGEQKKALLVYLLNSDLDFIILDNPFDNLDTAAQQQLTITLIEKSSHTTFVQIISRKNDLLPFITNYAHLDNSRLLFYEDLDFLSMDAKNDLSTKTIPPPLHPIVYTSEIVIDLKNVTVGYGNKTVLRQINWTIKKGEFWQLIGKNGSGKTTILSMLTGENPKGYGQELFLFGKKKGSGESIWDIKKNIGYFTPSMTDKFTGHHTLENMLISGLNDSIGLYVKPSEIQLALAKKWLALIGMEKMKYTYFHDLSMGQQRLVMTARAMIKHPLLLILDEPTASLDDASAKLLVSLVNKIARESDTATVFVSHRKEPGLTPDCIYELQMTDTGSIGRVK